MNKQQIIIISGLIGLMIIFIVGSLIMSSFSNQQEQSTQIATPTVTPIPIEISNQSPEEKERLLQNWRAF